MKVFNRAFRAYVLLAVLLTVVVCQAHGQTLPQEVGSLKKDVIKVLYAAGDIIEDPGVPHLQVQHSVLNKSLASMKRSVDIVQTILENIGRDAVIAKMQKDVDSIVRLTKMAVKLTDSITAMTPHNKTKEIGGKFLKIAKVINSTLLRLEKAASSF